MIEPVCSKASAKLSRRVTVLAIERRFGHQSGVDGLDTCMQQD